MCAEYKRQPERWKRFAGRFISREVMRQKNRIELRSGIGGKREAQSAAFQEIEASAAKASLEHPARANELIKSRSLFAAPHESGYGQILLQKSKVASVRIFGETLKREAIDDFNNFSRATEVADEFSVKQ